MSPIRCAIDSEKKKEKKNAVVQRGSRSRGIKSPKKCCESLSDLQGSGRTHANVVDQSQMSIALLKALVGTRSSSTPSRSHACHLPTFRHAEKEKKTENRILQLFEIVSLLISQLALNLQGSVPCMRKRDDIKTCSCWSRLWRRRIFYPTP